MKRALSNDMSLLQSFNPSSDGILPQSTFAAMGQHLQSKRPCFPEPSSHQMPGAQLSGQDLFNSMEVFTQQTAGLAPPHRLTPFSLPQQLPSLQEPAFQVPAVPYMSPPSAMAATQTMAAGHPDLCMPSDPMAGMGGTYMQHQLQQQPMLPPQMQQQFPMRGSNTSSTTAGKIPGVTAAAAPPGSLLAQMRSQATVCQQPQHQQRQSSLLPPALQTPEDWRPMNELQRLLPRLNQEYKREMQLLLKACQVAGRVTKSCMPATPSSGMLLLDPAAREQLQHQVLNNCNDKHAAVTAAFRVAAQAVAAAASSTAAGTHRSARAAAAAAVEVLGGSSNSSSSGHNLSALAYAAGRLEAGDGEAAPEAVSEALQQLRSSYHQELVAATSALFAICRGFGQSSTMAAAASQPIKNGLAAAQQQHVRVEQLWQDVLAVAAGGRE